MTDGKLDKDYVDDTSVCNMLMRVDCERVDVAVYSVVSDNTLIYRQIPLSGQERGLRGVEDVVYENPLLLRDFRRVYILVETSDYAVLPSEPGTDEALKLFSALHPKYDGSVYVAETATRNALVAYGLDKGLDGFLRRTFPGATVCPHIMPLMRYFASWSVRGNSRRMVCNFRRAAMDVIVMEGNRLIQANTFRFHSVPDAVYYILASRSAQGLDAVADEVLLSGDHKVREEVTPLLRTYIARVMPVIFPPQMFRAGKESMLMPFDLIVTPLCE